MSREPDTLRTDDTPAGMDSTSKDIPAGSRFSANDEILRIEQELVAEGTELENRAIPIDYHPIKFDYTDTEKVRELINTEMDKENPNKQLIGLCNQHL